MAPVREPLLGHAGMASPSEHCHACPGQGLPGRPPPGGAVLGRPPSRLVWWVVALWVALAAGAWTVLRGGPRLAWPVGRAPGDPVQAALGLVSNESIAQHLLLLTPLPHMAGTPANLRAATLVHAKLLEYGWAAHHVDYPVLLSYPLSISLRMTKPTPVRFSLREASFPQDPYSQSPLVSDPFVAYSPSATVAGEVVYANYARTEDFELLEEMGVNCSGKVVIARYGRIFRGNKVSNAAARGAKAMLIYSDPANDDPDGTSPDALYPLGRGIPSSGTQRGSIFLWKGDPETPFWPSSSDAERLSPDALAARLPRIPTIPISWGNAARILGALGGEAALAEWQGAIPGIAYHLGPGPSAVHLHVQMNQTRASIRNVVAVMRGYEEPNRYVVLGNHRDAWVYGAADPNSGTASLLEVARVLGALRANGGWQPRISIVLANWDAEEYGLVGSTEWVESNLNLLQAQAVAYVNVDVAVSEAKAPFQARATPQLDSIIREVAALVQDPNSDEGVSVLDAWVLRQNASTAQLERLGGGGSDFCAFLQHAGIASADLSFSGGYPMYHSVYDNYHWMTRFGDPEFQRNRALTQLWVALALRLSTDQVLPFVFPDYAGELQEGARRLNDTLAAVPELARVDLGPLTRALDALASAAHHVHNLTLIAKGGAAVALRRELNEQLMLAERGFLDPGGIGAGDFSWFKHLVYGPMQDNGYATLPFPALDDAIQDALKLIATTPEAVDLDAIQHQVYRLARAMDRVRGILLGQVL